MYFIYSTLLFVLISFTSLVISNNVVSGWEETFIFVGGLSGLVAIVMFIVMMFTNFNDADTCKRAFNNIREFQKRISKKQEDITRYKTEFKDILTEMYPQYEKDIFKGMASSDAKTLELMLVKYPELKFDGILTEYVEGLKKRLNEVYDFEEDILRFFTRIADINDSGWMLKPVPTPSDIESIKSA